MKITYIVAILYGMLMTFSGLNAQEPVMIHYTTESGLPSNTVYNIYPDSKGYIWFGTDKGIARYNGNSFRKFGIKDGLPDNEIFFFKEDYEGRLWLATWNGKLCYFKNDTFHTEKNTPWLKIPDECTEINWINIESDSSLTFQYGPRMFIVNIKGAKCKFIPFHNISKLLDTAPNSSVRPFFIDHKLSEHSYSMLTPTKKIIFDDKGQFLSVSHHYNNDTLTGLLTGVNASYPVYNDCVYDILGKYICKINNVKGWNSGFFFRSGTTNFLGGQHGLYINDTLRLLKDTYVSALAEDFQGNYWIGTLKNGAYILHPDFRKTLHYRNAYQNKIDHALTVAGYLYYVDKTGKIYREDKLKKTDLFIVLVKNILFAKTREVACFLRGALYCLCREVFYS